VFGAHHVRPTIDTSGTATSTRPRLLAMTRHWRRCLSQSHRFLSLALARANALLDSPGQSDTFSDARTKAFTRVAAKSVLGAPDFNRVTVLQLKLLEGFAAHGCCNQIVQA